MIDLSKANLVMVRRVDGWVGAIVRGCLGGLGEHRDDELSTLLDAAWFFYSRTHTSLRPRIDQSLPL